MKKIVSFLIFLPALFFSQIGINTSSPHSSSTLQISSSNKGVSFPRVFLSSYTDKSAIVNSNPTESLIVYNTNSALRGKTGFYYWDSAKWQYLFDDLNEANLLNSSRYYSGISSTGYTFTKASSQFYSTTDLAIGATINSEWTVITDLTKDIIVDRATNEILFNINGMAQVNNSSGGKSIFSSIGFFIDDKLVDVKLISIDFEQPCTYREFTIYSVASNIPVGNHRVKFAIRNRSTSSTQNSLSVTFGAKNSASSCNNTISNDEAKMSGTVYVNQPYVF